MTANCGFELGGTTGLLVASRLAVAEPNLSIVVLEQGPDVRNNPLVINPALFLTHLRPDATLATFYQSKESRHVAGRNCVVPTGGCLGGGSSINFMVYSRPMARDFDSWKAEGWSSNDLLPFLKKVDLILDI